MKKASIALGLFVLRFCWRCLGRERKPLRRARRLRSYKLLGGYDARLR